MSGRAADLLTTGEGGIGFNRIFVKLALGADDSVHGHVQAVLTYLRH
ncbi:hypothetical protein AB0L44_44720 [Nonomuraea wenchangensis]